MPAETNATARRARRGSALSDRQVAHSARAGQLITALLPGSVEVAGYAFGLDDYHLALVTPTGQRYLIHKSAHLVFGDERTFEREPEHEALDELVAPFRGWAERTYLGRHDPPSAVAE